ncbi:MAG TPA: glycosyltransferase family 2 protein [Bryobacteraceae bacterium]|nr:glycosyltransferase family 2 protein [Bryobacteraceae bacterium]
MPVPQVTVVIPTLVADSALDDCLRALGEQTFRNFEVIVVDNSGNGLARRSASIIAGTVVIDNPANVGFGAAINQGCIASRARYLATLNDDAVPHPGWLAALTSALEARPDAGMAASRILLSGTGRLDSAGMLVCADGSSKQRGHGELPTRFPDPEEALFPSACAALYRRSMLEDTEGFDEDFFLYSEDTDLGLRARWAGWKCLYVPGAVVEHRYSHSAGRASPLKAYYVERNRLFVIAKSFPLPALCRAPFVAFARYFWHAWFLLRGRGTAARFREEGHGALRLAWYILSAHVALVVRARSLWKKRREIRDGARITTAEFLRLLRVHSISAREVASL